MIHPDVHAVTVHPTSANRVTAATGGGLYRSNDGGRSWENRYHCYIRAVWVDPGDHRHMIAGPADGVSRNGRVEETLDAGRSWRPASQGMMPTPWGDFMVERFSGFENRILAVLSNGQVWSRLQDQAAWFHVLPEIATARAIAAAAR
jgi:hypothetical protein